MKKTIYMTKETSDTLKRLIETKEKSMSAIITEAVRKLEETTKREAKIYLTPLKCKL